MKSKLSISFSGGRTSAVMTRLCLKKYLGIHDMNVVFANTGCEHPKTLEFIDRCDGEFGFGVVWLEAVVSPEKGIGVRHKIVDFETASRNGEPFERYIEKYGMPDRVHKHCTSRLKEDVLHSFRKSIGWGKCFTAIGIRYDEIDRMSSKAHEKGFVYPLIEEKITKREVLLETSSWPFDLDLPGEHWGNCVWCWKKSLRKLMTLALEDESVFEFPIRMEDKHAFTNVTNGVPRAMFRERKSARDIIREAKNTEFVKYSDSELPEYSDLDIGGGCGESCEIGSDDD